MNAYERTAAAWGGVDVPVTWRGDLVGPVFVGPAPARVKVKDLPARQLTKGDINFLSSTAAVDVVALCTDLTPEQVDALSDDSLLELAQVARDRNGPRALRLGEDEAREGAKVSWQALRASMPKMLEPMLKEMRSILEQSLRELRASYVFPAAPSGSSASGNGASNSGKSSDATHSAASR